MTDIDYQENKIKKLLYEMSSIFTDIQLIEENHSGTEDYEVFIEVDNLKDRFAYLSKIVYNLMLVYFESKNLNNYSEKFKGELYAIIEDRNKALEGKFSDDIGEGFSVLTSKFWEYLAPFPFFGENDYEYLLKRTGLTYLVNILESTGIIIKASGEVPLTETQVYKAVRTVCKATFPSASYPSQALIQTAKCYIPDILIPALNCAVEYKYAENEQKLIHTIDEILIDVNGYDKNPTYKLFYAVFYVKPGIWTKKRFDDVWEEKEFPENWKGIYVIGE